MIFRIFSDFRDFPVESSEGPVESSGVSCGVGCGVTSGVP